MMQIFYFCTLLLLSMTGNVSSEVRFNSNWAVEINGDESNARKVAEECGFVCVGKVGNLDRMYHFREKSHPLKRTKGSVYEKTKLLRDHHMVSWTEHQKYFDRKKIRAKAEPTKFVQHTLANPKTMFNDPKWPKQWYLYDSRISRSNVKLDLHVIPVWNMNITGRGVKVAVISDGLEHSHPDLIANYDPLSSTNLNENDNDPTPDPEEDEYDGTRIAAMIGMVANNSICGVGVAYNAKIGGIRLKSFILDDIKEAKAFGFRNNYIDIYISSFGSLDNGKSADKPGPLALLALIKGVTQGRKGKGNLYVWPSGYGGQKGDSCSLDGYVSSIYSIPISSISPNLAIDMHSEKCSSIMATTFSLSHGYKSKLVAANIGGQCIDEYDGISASAPLAAGVFALALEAKPSLTWRDVKHLLAWTSQTSSLLHSPWTMNAAGFFVNPFFGFGQIDAANFVKTAISWVTVPPMSSCTLTQKKPLFITNRKSRRVLFNGSECYHKVKFIEHIVITITFQYSRRGSLQISLRSPHHMKTVLMHRRKRDKSNEEMVDWPFNTVHNWGEDPRGKWRIYFEDKRKRSIKGLGKVENVTITFHGTRTMPNHMKLSPHNRRPYDLNYNYVRNDNKYFDSPTESD